MPLSLSEGDKIGDRCQLSHRFNSPHRSSFPANQLLFVGGFLLSSSYCDSFLVIPLGCNFQKKPPWLPYKFLPLLCYVFFSFPDQIRRKSVCKMSDNLRKSVQNLHLGIDDAPIPLPPEIVSRAASINRFTLVVSTVNPRKQNLRALIGQMPRVWGLADSCVGRIMSPGKVQFKFRNEESMNLVLHTGPWSFNDWMLTVHRWYPNITEDEMKIILFWVRIHSIPTLYLTNAMARFIGNQLGPVSEVDFDENINNVGFVRVQLDWNCDEPLRFQRNFQFETDANTVISFQFERLRNFCTKCGSLKHDLKECVMAFSDDDAEFNDGDDNDDDNGSHDANMSETNTLPTIDPATLIPGLQPATQPLPEASVSSLAPVAKDSVSSSPSFFEDTDLTAERIRYLHAKFTREALKEQSPNDLQFHTMSAGQSAKRSRREFEIMFRQAEEAEDMATLRHIRKREKMSDSDASCSIIFGGAGGPIPSKEPI